VLTVVSVVLLIPPFLWPLDRSAVNPGIGLLSIALGFAGILLLGLAASPRAQSPPAIVRGVKASLAAIGFHSYSIYLWHMPIQVSTPMLVATFLPATATPDVTFAVKTGVYLATAVVVGIWIGRLIEQPSLSARDRFFPTRAGGLVDLPQPAHAAEEWTPAVSASR
jgi:peptidoglycan/LPS O-acetylase OafA/YrhL